jgi:hypothetical protein
MKAKAPLMAASASGAGAGEKQRRFLPLLLGHEHHNRVDMPLRIGGEIGGADDGEQTLREAITGDRAYGAVPLDSYVGALDLININFLFDDMP